MKDTKEQLGYALSHLMLQMPYQKITIKKICECVPISRKSFYSHYKDKDDLLQQMIINDFMKNAFPIIKCGMGRNGVRAFFKYVYDSGCFYKAVYHIDEGHFLQHCLVESYAKAVENVAVYAHPVENDEERINKDIYRLYTHSGLASIVIFWVKDNYTIDLETITRDTARMMEHPLSYVRDHFLL